jgi:poly(hydroxyalkanoate) depolymerase family esterase
MLVSLSPHLNPFAPWLDAASTLGSMFFVPRSDQRIENLAVDAFAMTECHEDHSLFVPPAIKCNAPMVVMLHGATQDPADFAAGTAMNEAAARRGFIVLYPAQPSTAHPHRCWNWFDSRHQRRSEGEPARLASLTLDVARQHGVDKRRIYVAGLSAGGAMAALLGELFPDVYAAVGVHSGLAPLVANDLSTALSAMRGDGRRLVETPSGMPTIVFHGDKDSTVHFLNGEQIIDACVGPDRRSKSSEHVGSDGRRFTRSSYAGARRGTLAEHWTIHDATHAWSGGRTAGTFADPLGPDASGEMLRFFGGHELPNPRAH